MNSSTLRYVHESCVWFLIVSIVSLTSCACQNDNSGAIVRCWTDRWTGREDDGLPLEDIKAILVDLENLAKQDVTGLLTDVEDSHAATED